MGEHPSFSSDPVVHFPSNLNKNKEGGGERDPVCTCSMKDLLHNCLTERGLKKPVYCNGESTGLGLPTPGFKSLI